MKLAYLEITFISGHKSGLKIDLDNQVAANKLRNLKAGSITTFDLLEDDPTFVIPSNVVGTITENTMTYYPSTIALLRTTVVESSTLET